MSATAETAAIYQQLKSVMDPELHVPITEIGMVGDISLSEAGIARVTIKLTTSACPMRSRITEEVTAAAVRAPGVRTAEITLDVMSAQERVALKEQLSAHGGSGVNRFAAKDSLTKVYMIASGKGGVGKSTVTVNLAAAMAASGLKVGLVDADIHGFSVPALMGITTKPTRLDELILPVVAYGVKVISIGMFVDGSQAVAWRGPMLHRALEQFLTDVHFGDLDVLLVDLPPGTGDIAISAAQLLPDAEIVLVTTPQLTAAVVAERAGSLSSQTEQKVAAVVENMGPLQLPDGSFLEVFGSGGGKYVAQRLTEILGYQVELAPTIPLDTQLRHDADAGHPAVIRHPEAPASRALQEIAGSLSRRARGLSGKKLPLSVPTTEM